MWRIGYILFWGWWLTYSCNLQMQASAAKLLKETCSYIKSLHREVDDLSDRLSFLITNMDVTSSQAEIIRSLLRWLKWDNYYFDMRHCVRRFRSLDDQVLCPLPSVIYCHLLASAIQYWYFMSLILCINSGDTLFKWLRHDNLSAISKCFVCRARYILFRLYD